MVGTEIAKLYATLDADTRAFESALKRSDGLISGVGNTLGTFVKVGIGAAVAGMGAFVAGIGSALSASAAFDKTMSGAQAILGATGEEMQQLNSLAMQLGKDTVFSAAEAGKAIEMLGQDGLNVQQIMGGAAKATVDLAAATGTDLTNAANIASKAMKAFDIPAEQMQTAINGISGAANINGLTIDGYSQAIAMAGAAASASGVSFDDFNATIAALAPAFSSGSDLGTGFKTFLSRLIPQSNEAADAMRNLGLFTGLTGKEYDDTKAKIAKLDRELAGLDPTSKNYEKRAHDIKGQIDALNSSLKTGQNAFFNTDGSMKDMSEIAGILQKSLSGLSDEAKNEALFKIFGTDASRVAAQLSKIGSKGIADPLEKIAKSDAGKMAQTRMDNLAGDVEQLSGSFDTLKIAVGQAFTPLARKVVQFITSNLNKLLGFDFKPFAARFDAAWERVQAVIQSTVTLFDRFASKTRGGLPSILDALGQTFTDWASNIWGWIEPGLTSAFTNLVNWIKNPTGGNTIAQSLSVAWNWFSTWAGYIWSGADGKGGLKWALSELWSAITSWVTDEQKRTQLYGALVSAWNWFASWAGLIWSGADGSGGLKSALSALWTNLTSWVTDEQKRTQLVGALATGWNYFTEWANYIWSGADGKGGVKYALGALWGYISSWVTDDQKRTELLGALVSAWNWFASWAGYIWSGADGKGGVKFALGQFWGWLTSWVTDDKKRSELVNALGKAWNWFADWAGYIWSGSDGKGGVKYALGALWGYLTSWVTDEKKRTELWNSITSTWTAFANWAANIWSGADGKSGVKQSLMDLLNSMNGWLLQNYPDVKPWETAFSKFIKDAKYEWDISFPDMASKFADFRANVEGEIALVKKAFSGLFGDLFGSTDTSGGGFVKMLEDWATNVEDKIVFLLRVFRMGLEALRIGVDEWKMLLSGDFSGAWEAEKQFLQKLEKLAGLIGNELTKSLPLDTSSSGGLTGSGGTGGGGGGGGFGGGNTGADNNGVVDQSSQGPGHRASGGNVLAGVKYLTAEHGRGELFVPQTNGYIYNAGDTAQILKSLGISTSNDNSTMATIQFASSIRRDAMTFGTANNFSSERANSLSMMPSNVSTNNTTTAQGDASTTANYNNSVGGDMRSAVSNYAYNTSGNDYTYNSSDASALTTSTTHRIELVVSGESNLPHDRASLRELSILLAREMNLSGAVLTMN